MLSVPFFIALPKVIVLNVVMLSVFMQNVVKLNSDMLSVFYVKYHFYCYAECLKEQQALKNVNNCLNANISSYLQTSVLIYI